MIRHNPNLLGPLPIVVGITGHRDLRDEDIPRLEELVRSVFSDLRDTCPSTPLVVLSPLAEGADRLGARVALECGVRLVVPLPLPRDIYVKDFESDRSRDEFELLLARASDWFEIPLLNGVTSQEIEQEQFLRDEQYGYLGAYIVNNSQFLIALWDGVPAVLSNGTGDIVTFNLEGVPERFASERSMLDPVESDPVYHIVTPRKSNPSPPYPPLTLRKIYPDQNSDSKGVEEALQSVFKWTDTFNHDAVTYAPHLLQEIQRSKSYIIDEEELERDAPELRPTLELYALVDVLAEQFSKRTFGMLRIVFLLVTVAAIIFDLFTHLYQENWLLLLGYLVLLVTTWGVARFSEHGSYQSKYLDYRALAEGLRVQFFWEMAGISDPVADYYLHKQRSELDWIRYAMRVWDLPSHRDNPAKRSSEGVIDPVRLKIVLRRWVKDQFAYFGRASKREEATLKKLERWGGGLILLGVSLALVQVIFLSIVPGGHAIHELLVAVALAPILAGLMIGYAEKRAFSDHAKQYERMSVLFSNAAQHLDRLLTAEDYERARNLVSDLGREALMENGDWVLIHRDRPIEVPKG